MNNQVIFRTTQKRIEKTLYTVKAIPSESALETAEQKLIRLVGQRVSAEMKNAENTEFIIKKPCF